MCSWESEFLDKRKARVKRSCHLGSRGVHFFLRGQGKKVKLAVYVDTLFDVGSWGQEVGGGEFRVQGMYISPIP